MKVFIVHAHAEPQSFNGTLTRHAQAVLEAARHHVQVSDLCEMKFNAVSEHHNFVTIKNPSYYRQQTEELYATETDGFAEEIQAEIDKLDWCDVLIFQFPLWWFSVPAILKGWVDRVFAMGRIYGGGKWYDNGVFKGKRAMLSVTTGGTQATYSKLGLNGHLDTILYPINHGILRFVGFDVLPPFVVWSAARITPQERQTYLDVYKQRLLSLQETPPIVYPSLTNYDETFQLKP